MKDLAGNALTDDAIKTLFVQRLPEAVRGIISIAEGDSAVWAKQADKMMETAQFSTISQVNKGDSEKSEIALLRKEIEKLKTSRGRSENRNDNRNGTNQRNRSKSSSRPDAKSMHQVCFYHFRYGNKARKCNDLCAHAKKAEDKSEVESEN